MPDNKWARLLAYVTGLVNQKLLLQNEYLIAENRILRAHLPARMRLSDPERSTLAEIGYGWLERLPKDYVGERHIAIVEWQPTISPNCEWCKWGERPGVTP